MSSEILLRVRRIYCCRFCYKFLNTCHWTAELKVFYATRPYQTRPDQPPFFQPTQSPSSEVRIRCLSRKVSFSLRMSAQRETNRVAACEKIHISPPRLFSTSFVSKIFGWGTPTRALRVPKNISKLSSENFKRFLGVLFTILSCFYSCHRLRPVADCTWCVPGDLGYWWVPGFWWVRAPV